MFPKFVFSAFQSEYHMQRDHGWLLCQVSKYYVECYKSLTYCGVSRHYLKNQDRQRRRLPLLCSLFGGCFEDCGYLCSNVGDVKDDRHADGVPF